jgi:hypothetical protein
MCICIYVSGTLNFKLGPRAWSIDLDRRLGILTWADGIGTVTRIDDLGISVWTEGLRILTWAVGLWI